MNNNNYYNPNMSYSNNNNIPNNNNNNNNNAHPMGYPPKITPPLFGNQLQVPAQGGAPYNNNHNNVPQQQPVYSYPNPRFSDYPVRPPVPAMPSNSNPNNHNSHYNPRQPNVEYPYPGGQPYTDYARTAPPEATRAPISTVSHHHNARFASDHSGRTRNPHYDTAPSHYSSTPPSRSTPYGRETMRGHPNRRHGGYGGAPPVHNKFVYNQQLHANSNNAIPEKTPTIRIRHPLTRAIHRIKLNRVYKSAADLRPQIPVTYPGYGRYCGGHTAAVEPCLASSNTDPSAPTTLTLCLEFLNQRSGCPKGTNCEKVHIAGLEYTWLPILAVVKAAPVQGSTVYQYEKGFVIKCYDSTLTHYYRISSEHVFVTDSSQLYIDTYNEHGDNSKEKFQISPECEAVRERLISGVISKEEAEQEMVTLLSDPQTKESTSIFCLVPTAYETNTEDTRGRKLTSVTHVNNREAMKETPRLPASMTVRVFETNSKDTYEDYPGDVVLLTDGAVVYSECYEAERGIPPRKNMQHCAHFHMNDVCRLGERCRFIHVLLTDEEKERRKERAEHQEEEEEEREGTNASSCIYIYLLFYFHFSFFFCFPPFLFAFFIYPK
ncbi:hypothetical protein AGDE_09380 [Angomonas deanei]|nr:hypothetical protein AGDE_09380 [Angomonas deanei]|eukprot:EPY30564.1 hypothetical protein AGDE_09380 [Angomonas deanei]